MSATATTPPEVELVRSFLNTIDPDSGRDDLDTPGGLAAWLEGARLVAPGTPASGRDLRLAQRLRAALRSELAADHDADHHHEAETTLDDVCAELPLKAVCRPDALAPAASGVRGALTQVVAAAATARIKGTWDRLKICPADDCAWAFYDTSRNRSKRWCSMEVCGNRSKVRAYRGRAR